MALNFYGGGTHYADHDLQIYHFFLFKSFPYSFAQFLTLNDVNITFQKEWCENTFCKMYLLFYDITPNKDKSGFK